MATSTIPTNNKSEAITVSFLVSNLSSGSAIGGRRSGNTVIISGYLNSSSEIASGTTIAKVTNPSSFANGVFETIASASGDISRLNLRADGNLVTERRLLANNWYSFSFTLFVN